MMIDVKRLLSLVPLLLVAACESPRDPIADLGQGTDDLLASVAYPPGPYGNTIGATIAPLSWIGYAVPNGDVLATTEPYTPYTMDDLRRSGRAYGIVHVSAFS